MIIEKATELGMALSNSDEFRRLQAAKAAMDADKHVNELMEQYTQKQDKMVSMLEKAGYAVQIVRKEVPGGENRKSAQYEYVIEYGEKVE